MLKKLLSDFRGLGRVCGWGVATRWLTSAFVRLKQCVKTRSLGPADLAMGKGPYRVRAGGRPASIAGNVVFGAIREIWVRDVYRGGGYLAIPQGGVVVDLGANLAGFSLLAAAVAPGVSVVAVEPNRQACATIEESFRRNGWTDRLQLCNYFVGEASPLMDELLRIEPGYQGVPYVSEQEFIERTKLTRIDFLKCDIEGSEWTLLTPQSRLLAMARQAGIEVHGEPARQDGFAQMLRTLGFEVRFHSRNNDGCILQAKRPDVAAGAAAA